MVAIRIQHDEIRVLANYVRIEACGKGDGIWVALFVGEMNLEPCRFTFCGR